MVDFNMAGSPSDISFFTLNAFSRFKRTESAHLQPQFLERVFIRSPLLKNEDEGEKA